MVVSSKLIGGAWVEAPGVDCQHKAAEEVARGLVGALWVDAAGAFAWRSPAGEEAAGRWLPDLVLVVVGLQGGSAGGWGTTPVKHKGEAGACGEGEAAATAWGEGSVAWVVGAAADGSDDRWVGCAGVCMVVVEAGGRAPS